MNSDTIYKRLKGNIEKIYDALDNITTILEVDSDDDDLTEMSICFREIVDSAITDNEECNINDIYEYIKENL
jgi:hypothetical protein